jgi:hypothetical protein
VAENFREIVLVLTVRTLNIYDGFQDIVRRNRFYGMVWKNGRLKKCIDGRKYITFDYATNMSTFLIYPTHMVR